MYARRLEKILDPIPQVIVLLSSSKVRGEGFQRVPSSEIETDHADLRALSGAYGFDQFPIAAAETTAPVSPAQWVAQVDSIIHGSGRCRIQFSTRPSVLG